MKKIFIFLTIAMFMCSYSIYARGGGGRAGGGGSFGAGMGGGSLYQSRIQSQFNTKNAYKGSIKKGTPKQNRTQTSSEKGTAASNGNGDMTRTQTQNRDQTGNE